MIVASVILTTNFCLSVLALMSSSISKSACLCLVCGIGTASMVFSFYIFGKYSLLG